MRASNYRRRGMKNPTSEPVAGNGLLNRRMLLSRGARPGVAPHPDRLAQARRGDEDNLKSGLVYYVLRNNIRSVRRRSPASLVRLKHQI